MQTRRLSRKPTASRHVPFQHEGIEPKKATAFIGKLPQTLNYFKYYSEIVRKFQNKAKILIEITQFSASVHRSVLKKLEKMVKEPSNIPQNW